MLCNDLLSFVGVRVRVRVSVSKQLHILFSGEERNRNNSKEHLNKSVDEGKQATFPSERPGFFNHHVLVLSY